MNLELKNKKVVISGASKGIGFAIAESFLKEGAKVILISRGIDQLEKARDSLRNIYGSSYVESQVCDCSDEQALRALSEKIIKIWKKIDIVVCNIGDGRSVSDAIPTSSQWNRVWESNFNSALYTSRIFGIEAFGAPVDYSTAKSAIIAFAKNLSRKVASDFRVNVIAPGNVFFPNGSWDEKMKNNPKETTELINSSVPMKRFGMPDEIADAVVFISSDRAKFITGSVLVIDGGQTVNV